MAKLSSTTIYGDLKVAHDIRTNGILYVNYDKPVWHTGNMGTGSGLDADKVDGLHFRVNASILEISTNGTVWTPVSMTANDILTQLKTVDGTISGLDADLLDGLHAAAFITHSLLTAANDFIVASGAGVGVKKTLAETKTILGINAVDNTADSAKPVSTAQQTALNLKANLASPTFSGTVSGITKVMVGLGSVDDTSDTAKPVSTAQQTALNLKANLASPTFSGTVSGITKDMVGLASVDNTADTAKPVSTAQQTALDLKANLASPVLSGAPTTPTAAVGTNTLQIASAAFVIAQVANDAILKTGGVITGTLGITGTTKAAGTFYAGTVEPTNTNRLNYDGYFHPTFLNLLASPATAVAATHYFMQQSSDGFVRPKLLADVRAELVSTPFAITAGSATVNAYVAYNGTTPVAGKFDGSATLPAATTRLNYNGYIYATKVFNGVFNDVAEFMYIKPGEVLIPGDILSSTMDGLVKAKEGDLNVVGAYSDTFGYALGADDTDNKVPVGISGRVQVFIENPEKLKPGALLVAGVNHAKIHDNPPRGAVVGKVFDCNTLEDGRYWMMIALM